MVKTNDEFSRRPFDIETETKLKYYEANYDQAKAWLEVNAPDYVNEVFKIMIFVLLKTEQDLQRILDQHK